MEALRIQVVLDVQQDALLFRLLDMKEDRKTGAAVTVTTDEEQTLQGVADSAVSSLALGVNDYAALKRDDPQQLQRQADGCPEGGDGIAQEFPHTIPDTLSWSVSRKKLIEGGFH